MVIKRFAVIASMIVSVIVLTGEISGSGLAGAAGSNKEELRQTCFRILTEALHDNLFNVRSAAAKALGESRDEAAVPLLLGVMSDQDSMVKSFAVESLGEIGSNAMPAGRQAAPGRQAAQEAAREAAMAGLIRGSKDPDAYIRGLSFKELGDLGDLNNAALGSLFKQGMNDPDPGTRFSAAVGLAKQGDQKAIETVIRVLHSPQAGNRAIAAGFLAGSRQAEILHALIQALGDSDPEVRAAAAASLGKSGGPNSVEPLLKLLQDEKPTVRAAAAEAVGELKQPKTIPALKEAMKDRDPLVRVSAGQSLALLSVADGQRYLKTALSDNDYDVRASAARALGMIGGQEAEKILRTGLSDPDLSVRCYAAGNILRLLTKKTNQKG